MTLLVSSKFNKNSFFYIVCISRSQTQSKRTKQQQQQQQQQFVSFFVVAIFYVDVVCDTPLQHLCLCRQENCSVDDKLNKRKRTCIIEEREKLKSSFGSNSTEYIALLFTLESQHTHTHHDRNSFCMPRRCMCDLITFPGWYTGFFFIQVDDPVQYHRILKMFSIRQSVYVFGSFQN